MYLGDFRKGDTVRGYWNATGADGASITRATNGTISVYKDGGTTQTTTGVTDTEDFDSVTGLNLFAIATTDSFYTPGSDYAVVLSGATIDGKSVNAVLAHFSLQRPRAETPVIGAAQAGAAGTVQLPSTASATDDIYNGSVATIAAGTGAGQSRYISDYVGSTKVASVDPNWTTTPDTTSMVVVTAVPPAATTAPLPVDVKSIAGQTANAAAAVTFPASIPSSTAIADAVRDDAIAMLVEGATFGATTMSLKNSAGDTVNITITRVARDAIATTVGA